MKRVVALVCLIALAWVGLASASFADIDHGATSTHVATKLDQSSDQPSDGPATGIDEALCGALCHTPGGALIEQAIACHVAAANANDASLAQTDLNADNRPSVPEQPPRLI